MQLERRGNQDYSATDWLTSRRPVETIQFLLHEMSDRIKFGAFGKYHILMMYVQYIYIRSSLAIVWVL